MAWRAVGPRRFSDSGRTASIDGSYDRVIHSASFEGSASNLPARAFSSPAAPPRQLRA
jgi:hypothetical protein